MQGDEFLFIGPVPYFGPVNASLPAPPLRPPWVIGPQISACFGCQSTAEIPDTPGTFACDDALPGGQWNCTQILERSVLDTFPVGSGFTEISGTGVVRVSVVSPEHTPNPPSFPPGV